MCGGHGGVATASIFCITGDWVLLPGARCPFPNPSFYLHPCAHPWPGHACDPLPPPAHEGPCPPPPAPEGPCPPPPTPEGPCPPPPAPEVPFRPPPAPEGPFPPPPAPEGPCPPSPAPEGPFRHPPLARARPALAPPAPIRARGSQPVHDGTGRRRLECVCPSALETAGERGSRAAVRARSFGRSGGHGRAGGRLGFARG
jgi:hypothetical protein